MAFTHAFLPLAANAQIIYWSFESSFTNISGSGSAISGIAPDFGSGMASAFHASSLTTWSSPGGNGSVHSFSADHWASGDYWQFQISTLGFAPSSITFSQTRTVPAPTQFDFSYSTDGIHFTSLSSYLVLSNNTSLNNTGSDLATSPWSTFNWQSAFSYTNLADSITSLQNQSAVYFRLVCDPTISTSGSERIDDFMVSLTPIPEPQFLPLAALAGAALGFGRRRRCARAL